MKTEQSYHNKPKGNACVSAEMLWDYLEGKLTAKQQHQVEAHLMDCPMCADALEGFQQSGNRALVTKLNADIAKRITYRSNWYLTAAAASVVLVASFGLLWWGLGTKSSDLDTIVQKAPEVKNQETISATTPEELRGPGSPSPDLNRPTTTSDGNVPLTLSNAEKAAPAASSPQAGPPALTWAKDESFTANAATAPNPQVTVPAEQESVNQNLKEDEGLDQNDVVGNSVGIASGATSPPAPKPTAPNVATPSAGYRSTSNSKAAKNKQAPSAAEANTKKASLAEGMQYYNTANYPEAIKVFKDVINDNPSNQEARYYLGMSYKGNGDKTKAIDELGKVGSTCLYYDDALWNRSLLLIEVGRKEEAKPLLQKLVDGGGKYAQMAMNKLNEL